MCIEYLTSRTIDTYLFEPEAVLRQHGAAGGLIVSAQREPQAQRE